MNRERYDQAGFTSCMTRGERVAALLYLPVHLGLLPWLICSLPQTAELSDLEVNLIVYSCGAAYMLFFVGRWLRRDFDPLCDRPMYCLMEIVVCYGLMLAFNMMLNSVLIMVLPEESANPNNTAVLEMAGKEYGKTAAMAVFLAPLVEEPIFRGGVFGLLRPRNRTLAYAVSMLLFAIYHVWGFALADPVYWVYLLQYLPVSYLLCRCYEHCNSIWGSIFLHMTINAVSISVLSSLENLLG